MPLKKITLQPGVARENTRYTNEGRWYESDKVRFRSGSPEKIGGWIRLSASTFLGVCRSLWAWVTLMGVQLYGVGTNLKFYISRGGNYYDITPIRTTVTLGANPFATTNGLATVVVTHTAHGAITGDFVTYSGATTVAGLDLNSEYQITYINVNSYSITAASTASATTTGGGAAVSAAYQINTGPDAQQPLTGWGASFWGLGAWGEGLPNVNALRLWSQVNFGEDLIFAPRGGGLYYWDSSVGVGTRAVALSSLPGAADVPEKQNYFLVSDVSRFVIAFGCTPLGSSTLDQMLIRWSDQEDAAMWTPLSTNQAGDIRLSHGSEIITALQTRQEILVWTDSALYSLQYLGAPIVWGATLLGDNISIISQNSAVLASGVAYWMGDDKFYTYDGRVNTLPSDVREYVFSDLNKQQVDQIFGSTVEQYNEVWWFYCSENSTVVDRYVIYNYLDKIWYYGTMGRTAWIDAGLGVDYPLAATYSNNLVQHEYGVDDGTDNVLVPIEAYITSGQFDIDDGHNFGFIWRMLPDITFRNSTGALTPQVTMTLLPLQNSGSGYNSPLSVAGSAEYPVARIGTYVVEQFTGQINTRIRGRQIAMRISSNQLGTQWQLGSPRMDIKSDGRR
jgi:hypothetical protein